MKFNETFTKVFFIILLLLCLTPWIPAPAALVGGFLFTLILGHPFPKINGKMTSKLLKASVIGLGFGMNAHSALQVGKDGFWLTVCSITITLVLGWVFGKMLKIPTRLSHLTASGTAICGGSAIAAVAPAVGADEK